ncbi:MAG TPA: hypothetical protein VFQ35_06620, partial [Polyangiaceae bacterium]|nr:hypothetical protein [Polyangiaceae bacterium]
VNVRGVHADWSEPVVTRFGGAFYLVNVALALGLYPDFTRPASLGLWLPLWSYLRQVSARLLAEEPPDAIWSLLSDLTPFGGSLTEHEEPRDWFVEPDWLRGFTPPKEWLATQSSSRLRILHPAGFAAIDARADLDPALIAAKLSEYGTGPLRFAEAEPRTSAQWIDWHVEYLRARLRLALRVDDSQIGPLLLEHRARVHVTATRIDVVFSLEELPIAIRLAGLDRDPGFLPTEARSLHFHFV